MVASVQQRLAAAFKVAQANVMDDALANGGDGCAPHTVVIEALTLAMNTLARLPDREAGWLYAQGFWPQIAHDHADQIENYKAMMLRIASGEESPDVLMTKRMPSAVEIDRMDAVFEVFPRCLLGKSRSRDWKILCYSAAGKSLRDVGLIARVSRETVRDRKDFQSRQIARKLVDLFPPASEAGAPAHPVYSTDRAA